MTSSRYLQWDIANWWELFLLLMLLKFRSRSLHGLYAQHSQWFECH
jgi:hypothetical protein